MEKLEFQCIRTYKLTLERKSSIYHPKMCRNRVPKLMIYSALWVIPRHVKFENRCTRSGLCKITLRFLCVLSHTSLVRILLVLQSQSYLLHPPLPNDRCLVAATYHLVLCLLHDREQGGQQLWGRGQPGCLGFLPKKHTEEF